MAIIIFLWVWEYLEKSHVHGIVSVNWIDSGQGESVPNHATRERERDLTNVTYVWLEFRSASEREREGQTRRADYVVVSHECHKGKSIVKCGKRGLYVHKHTHAHLL